MDIKSLEDIGLTRGEIKVYLALLKIGQSSTGAIAQESQVSRSKLYSILDKLAKKGLVGHLIKGGVTYFKAMEPKRILDYVEERNRQFSLQKEIVQKMIPELEFRQKLGKPGTEATLYQGFKAIKNFYLNVLDELPPKGEYYVIGATYGENRPGVKSFFENYHRQRAKKKIKVKMLANYDVKDKLVSSVFLNSEVRFLPEYLISNMIVVFYRTKSFIFFLSEEPIGFLVDNVEVTKGFKSYFDTFWKIAKK